MTKWNHSFGRQLRLLMQHLETKRNSDAGAEAEDTEHIRQVKPGRARRLLASLTLHLLGAGFLPYERLLHQSAICGYAAAC